MLAPDPRHPRRSQAEIPLIGLSEFARPSLIDLAAVTRTSDHLAPKLGGNVVQHLRTVFGDRMQQRPATGTGFVGDIDYNLDPLQMSRQRTTIALRRCGATLGVCSLAPRLSQIPFSTPNHTGSAAPPIVNSNPALSAPQRLR
jgi:hypothetical protein